MRVNYGHFRVSCALPIHFPRRILVLKMQAFCAVEISTILSLSVHQTERFDGRWQTRIEEIKFVHVAFPSIHVVDLDEQQSTVLLGCPCSCSFLPSQNLFISSQNEFE